MSRSTRTTRTNSTTRSSRSGSSSRTRNSTPVAATPAVSTTRRNDGGAARRTIGPAVDKAITRSRRLQHFTFQFNREDNRTAGCNSVRIVSKNGTAQELTLAEARSLYNFLADQFAGA